MDDMFPPLALGQRWEYHWHGHSDGNWSNAGRYEVFKLTDGLVLFRNVDSSLSSYQVYPGTFVAKEMRLHWRCVSDGDPNVVSQKPLDKPTKVVVHYLRRTSHEL